MDLKLVCVCVCVCVTVREREQERWPRAFYIAKMMTHKFLSPLLRKMNF